MAAASLDHGPHHGGELCFQVAQPTHCQPQPQQQQEQQQPAPVATSNSTPIERTFLSSFAFIQESPRDKREKTKLHDNGTAPEHPPQQPVPQPRRANKSSELKFKIESVGTQLEEDDDLDMCPARTRPTWPRQIDPWWKPNHPREKPPYSYATLIAHAILCSKDGRLTLSDIYRWISENYPFYVLGQHGWQVQIKNFLVALRLASLHTQVALRIQSGTICRLTRNGSSNSSVAPRKRTRARDATGP